MNVMITGNEYGEKTRPVTLEGYHFEAVSQLHHNNGMTAYAVYASRDQHQGCTHMTQEAADAMIAGMKAMPDTWELKFESGNQYDYETEFVNKTNGNRVTIYR